MNLMSTLILGAFLAAFLCLVCIVIKRRRINLGRELEYYLGKQGYRRLVKPIHAVNKQVTLPEQKKTELKLIDPWNDCRRELRENLRHEIHLLEEKKSLQRKAVTGDLSRFEEALLRQIKQELLQAKPRIWEISQRFVLTSYHWGAGSWLLEFLTSSEWAAVDETVDAVKASETH